VLLVPAEAGAETAIVAALADRPGGDLLTGRIAEGYRAVRHELAGHPDVRIAFDGPSEGRSAAPTLLATTADALRADPHGLLVECFGPTALLVTYDDEESLLEIAGRLEGQLTATVHGEEDDAVAPALLRELVDRAGRIVWNGWPTGVAVTHGMHHGGPYPATTAPLHTSVGTAALDRFLRPIALQEVPTAVLPAALRPYATSLSTEESPAEEGAA